MVYKYVLNGMLCQASRLIHAMQIIVFLLKREWAFIGWLVIYLCVPLLVASVIILLILHVSLAYPLYSFFLP